MNRRKFLKNASVSTIALSSFSTLLACAEKKPMTTSTLNFKKPSPIAICTWGFSAANSKLVKP